MPSHSKKRIQKREKSKFRCFYLLLQIECDLNIHKTKCVFASINFDIPFQRRLSWQRISSSYRGLSLETRSSQNHPEREEKEYNNNAATSFLFLEQILRACAYTGCATFQYLRPRRALDCVSKDWNKLLCDRFSDNRLGPCRGKYAERRIRRRKPTGRMKHYRKRW